MQRDKRITYLCCSLIDRSGLGYTPSAEQINFRSPSGDFSCLNLKALSETAKEIILFNTRK